MTQKKALLIDISLCIGCNACQDACQEANKLPELKDEEKGKLSDISYTALTTHEGKGKDGGDIYVRELCRHCAEPACHSVCLVGAFHKTDEGAVVYNYKKCIGCRYCMQACPFYVPKYEWKSIYPKVIKCVLCHSRISEGLPTACAEACPVDATTFGDYDDIVKEARRRIAEAPDAYVDKIYGLTEVGGTTVLYISSVPFEDLGFRASQRDEKTTRAGITDEPMPHLTWNALSKVPNVIGVGAVLLGGIWWITNRRHEVEQADAVKHNDSNSQNEG